jgi:CHAT domain-containing protein
MSRPFQPTLVSSRPLHCTRLRYIPYFGLVLLLISTTSALGRHGRSRPNTQSQDSEVRSLEPGKPIEREIAGGETHVYQLTLAAGQYARVAVDQRRINVAVAAFDPDGKKITDEDWFAIGDAELVSFIAESAKTYRLEVRAPDKAATKGSYEIKIKDLRAVTEREKNTVAGERLLAEGYQLLGQPAPESWQKGIEKYQQSLPFWQAAKEPAWEATTLYLIGYAYLSMRDKQKAFEFLNRSLPVAEASAKSDDEERKRLGIKVEVMAFNYTGLAQVEFGDRRKALELFQQALAFARELNDQARELDTLNYLASTHQMMGDLRQALDYSNQARRIASAVGDRYKESTLLSNMCVIKSDLGEYRQAIEFCNQALAIRRELKSRVGEATVLNNIGAAYSGQGEYQQSLDFYLSAYAIHKELGSRRDQGIALNNIGYMYATLGEYQKAIDTYTDALPLFRADNDQFREGTVLGNIAAAYALQKDFHKALELNQQVLQLRRAARSSDGEAVTLKNIGDCYSNLGDKQKALDYFQQAVDLQRKVGNQRQLAIALGNVGSVYRDIGQYQKALDYLNEALRISRTIGDPNNESSSLALIAGTERDRGDLTAAKDRIDEALAAVESVRVNLKSQQLRASYFASVRKYHEFNINLLMRLDKAHPAEGFAAAALRASEKSRARSLLEMLNEASAEIRQGLDPALVERERILRQTISDKADRQTRMLSSSHTEAQATEAAKELDALTNDFEQLEARIRQISPRYAALTQPLPLSAKEIQSQLLDDDTVLLEYALGENKSFVWVVTPTSLKSFELPKQAEIETAARKVYDLITAADHIVPNESPESRRKRLDQADAEYPVVSAALSRILLAPLASELKRKRLLIVGEGALQYVPFAALPEPVAPLAADNAVQTEQNHPRQMSGATLRASEDPEPLVLRHEIITLPSASVLAVLRQEAADRQRPPKTVAIFADPVFDARDSRVAIGKTKPDSGTETPAAGELRRSAAESGLIDFARLRFSRQEAEQIVRMASASKSLEALDFAANRAAATDRNLQQYRIVHFATHGLVNNQHAQLSGIVLSLVDERGQPQNGFLRLYEIYNLHLKSDLVVLSACQTALGKDIKGEGLIGLTRAFMYAGATRVVASLWQTEDRSTATLMGHFYEGMLAQGLSPAAALRSAQVSMWKDKRWHQPRYWAAFTIQGEWK